MPDPINQAVKELKGIRQVLERNTPTEDRVYVARVYRTSDQSIASGAVTPLSWTTEDGDTFGLWDPSQGDRFTIRLGGWYWIGGGAGFAAADVIAGRFSLGVRVNGGTVILAQQEVHTIAGKDVYLSIGTIGHLNPDDYVQIWLYHDFGGSKPVLAATATNQHRNYGMIARING